MIAEANLTVAALLGVERAKLLQRRFDLFVAPQDRDRWHRLFMGAMKQESAAIDATLQHGDGSGFSAHIDCRRMAVGQAKPELRIAITDLAEREPEEAASTLNYSLDVGRAASTDSGQALPAGEKPCRAEPDLQPRSPHDNAGNIPGLHPGYIAPTAVPVDVNVLKKLVGDDEEIIHEFLHDFRVSATKIAAELRTACATGEAAAAGAHAHKLKSSARSVGALALGELCAEMEKAGKAGDMKALAVLLPRFEQELMSVESFLEEY
jgi:HPt (histidine-containing phosphotransfer) domain-containing protein